MILAAALTGAEEETRSIDQRVFESAVELYRQGKIEQALSDFERIYAQFPSGSYANRALYELARHYYDTEFIGEFLPEKRDPKLAENYLMKIITEYPTGDRAPDALVRMGMLKLDPYVGPPRKNDAYADFLRVNRVYPSASCADEASFGLGYTLYLQKEFAKAGGALEKTLLDYPRSRYLPLARYYAARALAALGRSEEAFHHLACLRSDFPEHPYAKRALDLSSLLAKLLFPYTYTFREAFPLGKDKDAFRRVTAFRATRDGAILAVDDTLRQAARFTREGKRLEIYPAEKPRSVWETMDGRVVVAREGSVTVGGTAILITENTPKEEILYAHLTDAVTTSRADIVVFDEQRKEILRASGDGAVKKHLIKTRDARGLFCDPYDRLWFLSPSEHILRCVTLEGTPLLELSAGRKESALEQPAAFAIDFLENVYVLDTRKRAVLIFDPTLTKVLAQITPSKGEGDFSRPLEILASEDGSVLIFDEGKKQVLRYE